LAIPTRTAPEAPPADLPEINRPVGVEARRRTVRSIALAVVGVLIVTAAAVAVSRSAIFAVRHLTVSGNHRLSTAEIERAAGVSSRSNVIWMSTASLERRLLSDPWIASAGVSRLLPSTLTIAITERVPVAVAVKANGADVLIASDGTVLGAAPSGIRLPAIQAPPDLTLKSGSRVPLTSQALRAAANFPPLVRARIATVSLGRAGIELRTRDGVRVIYGDASEAAAKGAAIEAVLVWLEQHHVSPLYIDVSAPTTPAVMPASGQVTGIPGVGTDAIAGTAPPASPSTPTASPTVDPSPPHGG
jgi:cell division protein FtsQ